MEEIGKSKFWPIKKGERSFFLLLASLLLLLAFNHSVLHDVKDTLAVGYLGSESIAFMKFWITLPGAVLFFLLYSKLTQHFSQRVLLISILLTFAAFFLFFSFYLFPVLHPIKQPIPITGNQITFRNFRDCWDIALFYLFSELWGNIALGVLFWGFANRTIRFSVAKRFYTLLNLAAAIGGILGGLAGSGLSYIAHHSALGYDLTLKLLSSLVCINIFLGIGFYLRVIKSLKSHPDLLQTRSKSTQFSHQNLIQSVRLVVQSKTLLLVAIMVVCFGLSFNFIEIVWKFQVRKMYPDLNQYGHFISNITIIQGIITSGLIIVGASFISRMSWFKAALLTPAIMATTCMLFFIATYLSQGLHNCCQADWLIMLPIYFGAFHFIAFRTCRLALFEPTKEMIFIPLSRTLKTEGKAAVDILGDRFGKGGGSLLQYSAINWLGSPMVFAPYAFALVLVFIALWIYALFLLRPQFASKQEL